MIRFRAAVVFASLAVSLAACMDIADPDQITKMPTEQLCEDYYFGRQAPLDADMSWPGKQMQIKKELETRNAVSAGDWVFIDKGQLSIGMSECALKAAWGHPLRIDHITTAAGASTHYVYTLVKDAYLTDGKVTGFRG